MIGNIEITKENGKNILFYTPEPSQEYAKYPLLWLDSWRNDYFFKWTIHEVALKQSLYAFLAEYKSLDEVYSSLKKDEIIFLMNEICLMLEIINNSVLAVENILLDISNIYAHKIKKSIEVKFVYLPLKTKMYSKEEFNDNFKLLMTSLVKRLIELDKKDSNKVGYQKLLSSIPSGYEALHRELNSLSDVKQITAKKDQKLISSKVEDSLKEKFSLVLRSLNFPNILIGIAFICILLIYAIQYSQNGIQQSHLFTLLAIVAMSALTVIFLLLAPGSPYRIEFSSSKLDKNEFEFPTIDDTYSDKMALHPQKLNRTMRVDLIEGYIPNLPTLRTWNVLTSEFTIGSHEHSDLRLRIEDSNELYIRIVQRAGSFFIASISKNVDCFLESRYMNRFDEYELSTVSHIKLLNLHFRLTIQ